MKVCTKCKENKNEDCFYIRPKLKYGSTHYCKECIAKIHHVYEKNNRIKLNAQKREYKKIYDKKPKNILNASIHWGIWSGIRGRRRSPNSKWEKLIGYSLNDLMKHLEKQFDENMNWGNYGGYWELDHIKPKSSFKFTSQNDIEFKECWSLSNLRPLEKMANRKKNKFI